MQYGEAELLRLSPQPVLIPYPPLPERKRSWGISCFPQGGWTGSYGESQYSVFRRENFEGVKTPQNFISINFLDVDYPPS